FEHAQAAVRRSRRLVLVEGFMDVLACHAAGVTEAVAALGTAFTDDHARLCGRFAKHVVLAFDGDSAGQKASLKAASRLLAHKLQVTVAALADGLDPDDTLQQKGADALKTAVTEAQPALEHFIAQAFVAPEMNVEARVQAVQGLAPLLLALGPGLERD